MQCECDECGGTGEVRCLECDGSGMIEGGIVSVRLDPSHEHFSEIQELQRDADRARDAAEWLTANKPEHAASYRRQLDWTLQAIEVQAANLLEDAA